MLLKTGRADFSNLKKNHLLFSPETVMHLLLLVSFDKVSPGRYQKTNSRFDTDVKVVIKNRPLLVPLREIAIQNFMWGRNFGISVGRVILIFGVFLCMFMLL